MKLVIELSENDYKALKEDGVQNHIALADTIIACSVPYEERPQGDLISREALKDALKTELAGVPRPDTDEDYYIGVKQGLKLAETIIDNASSVAPNWRFYYDHGYAQAKRDLKKEIENLVAGGAEGLKDYYKNGSKSDENSWIGGVNL